MAYRRKKEKKCIQEKLESQYFLRSVPKVLKIYLYSEVDNNTLSRSSCKFSLYYQVVYWPKRIISPHPSYICNKLYWSQNSCNLKILFCFILSQILHFGEQKFTQLSGALQLVGLFAWPSPSLLWEAALAFQDNESGKTKDCQEQCDRQMSFCTGVCPWELE